MANCLISGRKSKRKNNEFNKSLENSPDKVILTKNILDKELIEIDSLLNDTNPTNPLEIKY